MKSGYTGQVVDEMDCDVLQGRVALVTGASRGIGRACAVALAEWDAVIAVNYRQAVRFLASPDADYLTGITLDVNGGSYIR